MKFKDVNPRSHSIIEYKNENYIILGYINYSMKPKALLAKWQHPISEGWLRGVGYKLDSDLEVFQDDLSDCEVLLSW